MYQYQIYILKTCDKDFVVQDFKNEPCLILKFDKETEFYYILNYAVENVQGTCAYAKKMQDIIDYRDYLIVSEIFNATDLFISKIYNFNFINKG